MPVKSLKLRHGLLCIFAFGSLLWLLTLSVGPDGITQRYHEEDDEGISLIWKARQGTYDDNQGNTKAQRIAIVTLYDHVTPKPDKIGGRYLDVLHLSLDNKFQYAARHGYPFYIDNHQWIDKDRPVAWSKLLAIASRLESYDWVFWVDIDTLFMNWNITLESLTDDRYDLIVTKDASNLNSGVMLFKSSPWSKSFLLECYNQTEFLIHKDIYEQRAIIKVLGMGNNRDHVKFLKQNVMNSYTKYHGHHAHYKEGDFIIHFAGCRYYPLCKSRMDSLFVQMYISSVTKNHGRNLEDHVQHHDGGLHHHVEAEIEAYNQRLLELERVRHSETTVTVRRMYSESEHDREKSVPLSDSSTEINVVIVKQK